MVNWKVCHVAHLYKRREGKTRNAQTWIDLLNQCDEWGVPGILSAVPGLALQFCSFHCALGGGGGGVVVNMPLAIKWASAVITQVKSVAISRFVAPSSVVIPQMTKWGMQTCLNRSFFPHTSRISLWSCILVHRLTGLLCSINAATGGGRREYCHERCL